MHVSLLILQNKTLNSTCKLPKLHIAASEMYCLKKCKTLHTYLKILGLIFDTELNTTNTFTTRQPKLSFLLNHMGQTQRQITRNVQSYNKTNTWVWLHHMHLCINNYKLQIIQKISTYLSTRTVNKLIQATPHTIKTSEASKSTASHPSSTQNSNKAPFYQSKLHKVDASSLCLFCSTQVHDITHLYTHLST